MKLYLSSYRLATHGPGLGALASANRHVGVIQNALDFATDLERKRNGLEREFSDMISLGLIPEEINLRNYFGAPAELGKRIDHLGLLWVTGGNTFLLRRAMRQCGLDRWLLGKARDASFVYAGYSAGACVMTPTLKGIDLVDDPSVVAASYEPEVIWEGLGLVDYSIAPHFASDHPESLAMNKTIEYFVRHKMLFVALRDGEAIVCDTLL